jgi:putative Mn2+ efflux pump MntP
MLDIIILAIALSMDAFAVSIGLGAKHNSKIKSLGLIAAIYFGLFQALMPLLGYLAGRGIIEFVETFAPWIAFILLALIGVKMIYAAMSDNVEEVINTVTHRVMLMLAIATSIDAMAAGFTLTVLPFNPLLACALIGFITFVFSWIGVFIGAKTGTWLESKAELLGGIVLILIGLKILLF